MGVNDDTLQPGDQCISNASCTTNCLAPMVKVLEEEFGLEYGLMTTIHAYTNDQNVADQIHKDLHRARAAALNIIPTTTGAAKAVGKVIPAVDGKLTGFALRVPVPAGSVTDLTATLKKGASADDVNAAMKAASEGVAEGHSWPTPRTRSSPRTSSATRTAASSTGSSRWASARRMVKVMGWYDNEFGYSNRTADLIAKIASM